MLGLICRRRLRAVGRLAAHSNDVEGHCTVYTDPVSTINCCLLSSSVAVGMVVVANVAVLLNLARGRRAGRRAVASVVGWILLVAAAGNGVDGCFIVRIDGGDGVAPPGPRSRESWMPRGPRVGPRVLSLPWAPSWMLTKDLSQRSVA